MAKKKSKSVKSENLIHVKLDYFEAKKGKRDLLSSQANMLNILKKIDNYKRLRSEELKKKVEIAKKTKELKMNLTRLMLILPRYKIPGILKKEEENEKITLKEIKDKPIHLTNTLDSQLEEIQRKLKALQE